MFLFIQFLRGALALLWIAKATHFWPSLNSKRKYRANFDQLNLKHK